VSIRQDKPDFLPDRLEAGTQNIAGVAGLLEGLRFVRSQGEEKILDHERRLAARAAEQLSALPGVRVYAARGLFCQSGVLSFQVEGMDCEEVGETLGGMGLPSGQDSTAPPGAPLCRDLKAGTVRAMLLRLQPRQRADQLAAAVGAAWKIAVPSSGHGAPPCAFTRPFSPVLFGI
jgi:selenocysteine lyase/cysteine desulfurase